MTARDLVRFLKSQGFIEDRQTGSHLTLWHEGRQVSVTVPMHTSTDIGRGLAVRILRDAGFSVDDYLRLR
ncbi:MAG: type II toxin-antitoxin system HicA family toxin [Dehalococcoidia bacterium]